MKKKTRFSLQNKKYCNYYKMDKDYEMRYYKHLHYINNNNIKTKNNKNNKNASFLNKNLKKMNLEEKKSFLFKCVDEKTINKLLLKFELENLIPKTNNNLTLKEFSKLAKNIINRYQYNAGGYQLEDKEWNFYDTNSEDYSLDNNEILLENSIYEDNINDSETTGFIDNLTNLLNKLSDNIDVKYEMVKSKKESLVWTLIKCTKN